MNVSPEQLKKKEKIIREDRFLNEKFNFFNKLKESQKSVSYKVQTKQGNQIRHLKIFFYDAENCKLILKENLILKMLKIEKFFPEYHSFESWKHGYFMEMEFISQNLEHQSQKKKYSMEEIINFAIKGLQILKALHGKNIIHRNLHPKNFFRRDNGGIVLTNFIAALKIKTPQESSLLTEYFADLSRDSLAFASINHHKKISLGKKDDLQSFFYVVYYIYNKGLPWYRENWKQQPPAKEIKAKKQKQCQTLFSEMGYNFQRIFDYIRSIKGQQPNYQIMKNILTNEKQEEVEKFMKNSKLKQKLVRFQKNPVIQKRQISMKSINVKQRIKEKEENIKIVVSKVQREQEKKQSKSKREEKQSQFSPSKIQTYKSITFKNPFLSTKF